MAARADLAYVSAQFGHYGPIDLAKGLFVLRAKDEASVDRGPRYGIGKCSANVSVFGRESGKMKSRKSFVFMEPAPGLEPGTY